MIRSRRNDMLSTRWLDDTPAASRSGYFAPMQAMIAGPLFDAQFAPVPPPPPPPPPGLGVVTTLGVRNTWTALQSPSVSASIARTRQYWVALFGSGAPSVTVVSPTPSLAAPLPVKDVNPWLEDTWNS